ncbi:Protein phosphatase 2C [Actinopolyspora mzabensis]|uniref:Protein phosphatase 2C n=1 Tax=Actinopolyspora mzabensis TaxID=995066 RepID=A0A1G8WWX8_ACTMZ|nr:protein phosphatase 2C domain-containing protein [Actinopolyspora mzabensis]SDJ82713.1 Protein phosphatase 2C [Actinopolyspora mzabensis]
MPTVEVAEQAGSEPSEDVVLTLPNAVVVLDGATSLRPTERTGGWYAAELAAALRRRLELRSHLDSGAAPDLADSLASAIEEVSTAHGLQPGHSPSTTVSILRWDERTVEALVLADSPIVVFTDSGPEAVTDDRLHALRTTGNGDYRQRLRGGGGFDERHHDELRAAVDATGRWRNVEGGFWVAEADPSAAHRAIRRSWPRTEVRSALLASDGVSCGVDQYDSYRDWRELLAHARAESAGAVLERVRASEHADPDGSRWPRPKRHDDQALAVVEFAPDD